MVSQRSQFMVNVRATRSTSWFSSTSSRWADVITRNCSRSGSPKIAARHGRAACRCRSPRSARSAGCASPSAGCPPRRRRAARRGRGWPATAARPPGPGRVGRRGLVGVVARPVGGGGSRRPVGRRWARLLGRRGAAPVSSAGAAGEQRDRRDRRRRARRAGTSCVVTGTPPLASRCRARQAPPPAGRRRASASRPGRDRRRPPPASASCVCAALASRLLGRRASRTSANTSFGRVPARR